MFEKLLRNQFSKNVDIINTTNKILVDRIPLDAAFTMVLQNSENQIEVLKILDFISTREKSDFAKLSLQRKKPYIIELNKIISRQMMSHINNYTSKCL